MKIESLYGVTHRLEIIQFGAFPKECRVSPSEQLLEELSGLARGTRVGIESFPETTFEVDGIKMGVSQASKYYWQRIIDVCQARGLEIVYLDDLLTFKKHVAKLLEEESLMRQQEAYIAEKEAAGQTPFLLHDKRLRDLEEAIYKARVEADYIREVAREEQIRGAILREMPTVIIVGEVHGDFFVHGENPLPQAVISIGSYHKERSSPLAENIDSPLLEYLWPVPTRIINNSAPDESCFLARDRLTRSYNAVTLGRIIPGKTPHLIGTWDAGCRPRGLFEIYINDGPGFSGLIEDILGTASFSGEMDPDNIEFQKTYLDRYSLVGNAETISYRGVFQRNQYQGNWKLRETTGYFTLKKFKP